MGELERHADAISGKVVVHHRPVAEMLVKILTASIDIQSARILGETETKFDGEHDHIEVVLTDGREIELEVCDCGS